MSSSFVHVNKERLFYIALAVGVVVALLFVYSDKIWNAADREFTPYVSEDSPLDVVSSGSVDASVRKIHIAWEKGNVTISYTPHNRIVWRETYTQGIASQFNTHQYWLNTHTLFINYVSQEYYAEVDRTRREISKDLQVYIPQGIVLDELIVSANGTIDCEVAAQVKEIKEMSPDRATK